MTDTTSETLQPGLELTFRTIAMPADTNPYGHIFGGWLMSQMDLAAYVRSSEISGGRTVTAAVKEMTFAKPVHVGDTICIFTRLIKSGRSSITLDVEVWRQNGRSDRDKVTQAIFVMVAVDDAGRARPFAQLAA